jgi:hypothetical protein
MRESSWRITWNPLGTTPRVMLDFGDLMEREVALDGVQLAAVGTFDFALSATPSSRGNRRRRLDFGKTVGHDSDASAWHECAIQLAAGPWGGEAAGVIELRPRAGSALLLCAALLSTAHEPSAEGGIAESVHEWSFRCTRLSFATVGEGINIIGGWYNSPGGGVTIIIPGGSGVVPGDVIHVGGVPGLPPGYYNVGSSTGGEPGGGQVITLPNAEPDRGKREYGARLALAGVSTASKNGSVHVTYPGSEVRVSGCDDGAAYQVWNGASWVGIAPDVWGRATVAITVVSSIQFGPWWGAPGDFLPGPPLLTPLPIDGIARDNLRGGECAQTTPSSVTVKLRRNGVEIHQATFAPSWETEDTYVGGSPANASLNASSGVVLSLIGPGGGIVHEVGMPGQITGGTVTKVQEVTT